MPTTREQLADGFALLLRQGLRLAEQFSPEDWQYQVHSEEGGWTVRQVFAHLTSIAEILPTLLNTVANAPAEKNVVEGVDIDAMNAQAVAAKDQLSQEELIAAFKTAHERLIEHIRSVPDDLLQQQRRFGPRTQTIGDILESSFVLHGLAHLYQAQARPLT